MGYRKIQFAALVTLMGWLGLAYADDSSHHIMVTRKNITHERLIVRSWLSEYPEPVINIKSKTKGVTVIKGYTSLTNPIERKQCTVRNGLYHPWSQTKNSVIEYLTLTTIDTYEVKRTPSAESLSAFSEIPAGRILNKGDIITDVIPEGEGQFTGTLVQPNQMDVSISFDIDTLWHYSDDFSHVHAQSKIKDEQWLYLKCNEGYKLFVQDTDLLKQPEVKQGHIERMDEILAD